MMSLLNLSDISLDSFDEQEVSNDESDADNVPNEEANPPDSFIDKILNHFIRHNLTLICLEDLMKLLNAERDHWNKLPTMKVSIIKLFRLYRELFDVFHLIKCATCKFTTKIVSENKNWKCGRCDAVIRKSETSFFVYIPVEQQIIRSIKRNNVFVKNTKVANIYCDAHDGSILKNVIKEYGNTDVNVLSLCLNLDGVFKFKSNVLSVWPIQLIQNYLPPKVRYLPQNIIVAGLYYNQVKPNCYDFMLPFIQELNSYKVIKVTIEEMEYKFKPIVTHCAVDLPAKSMLQRTKQYGSYNGCTYCHIPGEAVLIEAAKKNVKQQTKKANENERPALRKFVRYVEGDEPYELRTGKKMKETMLSVAESGVEVDGVTGVSCLVGLQHFDIVWSFGTEYMHACLLGTTKRFLNYFCNSKFKSKTFYIDPYKRCLLSKKICAIKPTSNITRKPRSLDQRKHFKASEFRSMLLYYLPVCLPGFIPHQYVAHFRLFSAAVYTLLKAKISAEEIDNAEEILHKFAKDHQHLFGKGAMVMVVHLMTHLAESVRKLGPLWCHSAFGFERNNGSLLKLVNGTSDVLHQVSYKYVLKQSLDRDITSKINNKILLGRSTEIREESLKVMGIDFSNVSLIVYKRIQLNKLIYTSSMYTRPKTTIDYFIGLKSGTFGIARFYFEYENKICVVIDTFEEVDQIYHIIKVRNANITKMAPIDEINKKYIYMKVGLNEYISSPPNPYEKE